MHPGLIRRTKGIDCEARKKESSKGKEEDREEEDEDRKTNSLNVNQFCQGMNALLAESSAAV
jgi:hypothetical protein